jgi:hypothetical protein
LVQDVDSHHSGQVSVSAGGLVENLSTGFSLLGGLLLLIGGLAASDDGAPLATGS